MSRSNDAGHFFQTTSALETSTRKAAKSKNTRGKPIKLGSKLLAVHADPQLSDAVYVAEAAGEIKRVVLETGKTTRLGLTATAPLTSIALDEKCTTLYAGCWDKDIYSVALSPSANGPGSPTTAKFTGHTDFVKCLLATSLNGQPILISGGADAQLIVWDPSTSRPLHKLPHAATKALQDLAIDPFSVTADSFTLFTASSDREIRRWHISRTAAYELPESLETPILAHETSVYRLRFDADGDLWTASADKTAKHLVRERDWAADTVLPHVDFVRDVWVGDAVPGLVVTACRDEEVRVWDAATGKVVCCYSGHFEEVTGLAGNGGRGVVSVSIDGTVRRWSLERAEMEKYLEEVRREEAGEEDLSKKETTKAGMLTAEEEAELAELMDDDDE